MNFFKKIIIFTLAIVIFSIPFLSFAQVTINPNLPGAQVPSSNNNICSSIINFYWFAIFISGILAFGAIVYGGIRYELAAGNPGGQSEGKKWIMGALEGMLLLFSAYLILKIINPALTKCELPQLSSVEKGQIVLPGSTSASGGCNAPSFGDCSIPSLEANGGLCLGDLNLAGGVCLVESGNNRYAMSTTDKAIDGSPVSVGLFQINISANDIGGLNCPSAFTGPFTGIGTPPTIINRALYNKCVAAAQDMRTNIGEACKLSRGGLNYGLWGPATRRKCNL